LKYYEKALGIRLKIYGKDNLDVAGSYNNIGVVWYELGDYKTALEHYEKAYAIYIKLLGEADSNTQMERKNIEEAKEKMRTKK